MNKRIKKIVAIISCLVMGISTCVVANAATYSPSSSYYTQRYIVNRNGVSYNGTAHRRTGMHSEKGYTLDGHISIIKPDSGNFKHCAVDCVFTYESRTASRYNSTVFNTPSSGISVTLSSVMSVVNTSTGVNVLPGGKSEITKVSTNYKMSNSSYVDTTSGITLYGNYWTYKNGTTYKVPSFVVRY